MYIYIYPYPYINTCVYVYIYTHTYIHACIKSDDIHRAPRAVPSSYGAAVARQFRGRSLPFFTNRRNGGDLCGI